MLAGRLAVGLVVIASVAFGGCEHDDVCSDAEAQRLGDACGRAHLFSTFPTEEVNARAVVGRVRAGHEPVGGALVLIQPSFGTYTSPYPTSQTTNDSGYYDFVGAPDRYDLSIRTPGDVIVFRGLADRYVEPEIAADAVPRAFAGHFDVTVDPAPSPGTTYRFFVSGDDSVDVTGDLGVGITPTFRKFGSTIDVHVIAYPDGNPALATAYGVARAVVVQAGANAPLHLHLDPITAPPVDVLLAVVAPPQTTVGSMEIVMDLGRRSTEISLARGLIGDRVKLALVPNARWFARLKGTIDGGVTDAGSVLFDPATTGVTAQLTTVPTLEAPVTDAIADGALVASAPGVVEHTLTPVSGIGSTIRIVTVDRSTPIPDVRGLGVAPPTGRYVWTARVWPDLSRVDSLAGQETRSLYRNGTSAPRTIELR